MWTLIIVFMMNGSGHLTSQQVHGFTSNKSCLEASKRLSELMPNNKVLPEKTFQLTVNSFCVNPD